MLAVSYT